tara:strand:+ start:200 stop:1234 length:1035 start_codon:yes stop_codon:yes gene_type:complete
MGGPFKYDLETRRQAVEIAVASTIAEASRRLNIPRATVQSWVHAAATPEPSHEPPVVYPTFPDEDVPAEDILDLMERRFEQRQAREQAEHWFAIKEKTNEAIAYSWFGDPHIGSNGCNIKLLRRDIERIKSTPGMFAANCGDSVDNWGGSLVRLYAENDVSRQTERRLARWFLEEAGIPWRLWLLGNHDVMDQGLSAYLEGINAHRIPVLDWRAKFRVLFPNGCEIKIDAAHDHKGSSIYNPLHGQKRASLWDEEADLYIAGHRHSWALASEEVASGRVINMARARGYKYLDEFARRRNYVVQQCGASIVTVFDPQATSPARLVQMFADVEAGADYLTWLRSKS